MFDEVLGVRKVVLGSKTDDLYVLVVASKLLNGGPFGPTGWSMGSPEPQQNRTVAIDHLAQRGLRSIRDANNFVVKRMICSNKRGHALFCSFVDRQTVIDRSSLLDRSFIYRLSLGFRYRVIRHGLSRFPLASVSHRLIDRRGRVGHGPLRWRRVADIVGRKTIINGNISCRIQCRRGGLNRGRS